METDELQVLVEQSLEQIAYTTSDSIALLLEQAERMRANEDAQIYQHLRQAFSNILDPNIFPTMYAPQGHRKTISVDGHSLEVTVIHREPKLEKISGVDVIYNLRDWKTLAFQHKKRDKKGDLGFTQKDVEQRDKIQELCGRCKLPRKVIDDGSFIRPSCASVYVMGDAKTNIRHVLSACRIEEYRRYYRTSAKADLDLLPKPPDLETVDRLFLACLLGQVNKNRKDKLHLELMRDQFLANPDLVFNATLRRS